MKTETRAPAHTLEPRRARIYRDAFEREGRGPMAFVAVTPPEECPGVNAALGVAVANERGYHPVPLAWARFPTFDSAQEAADLLNLETLEHDEETAMRIQISTMGGVPFTP